MTDELITEAEIYDAPEWAWRLANDIVMKRQGCGNAAVLIHRAFTAQLAEAREAERAAVVAFIREQASNADARLGDCTRELSAQHFAAASVTCSRLATAIEAGEHLT